MKKLILAALICLLPQALRAQTPSPTPAAAVPVQDKSAPQQQPAELREADNLSASVAQLYAERSYKEALPLAQRALALREKVLKDEDPLVGVALHNLAALYIALGDAGKAEPLCERILVRREQGQPPTSKATLNALTAYACIVSARGRIQVKNKPPLNERISQILLQDAIAAAGLKPPANLEEVGKRISSPPPQYPGEAKSFRLQGSVFVVLDIDGAGQVLSAEPLPCGDRLKVLAEAGAEAARRSTFALVSIAGRPIRRKAFVVYNFVLR
ncbi:MAG TPA: tetratricopeptide repeat protein [Pyrinomonadaceae bacterium]|jgi:outer membrane biosynthesis protein TonB